MKTSFTSVDHCVFDLSGVGLLMTTFDSVVSDYLVDICLICWLDLSRVENLFVSKSLWYWLSLTWLSLLSYWLRLFGWSISCLTVKYSLTVIEVGYGVIELSVFGKSLVDNMWSLLVAQMCLLLDELGQVRRVGWLSKHLIRLTQIYDWFCTGTQASWYSWERLAQVALCAVGLTQIGWVVWAVGLTQVDWVWCADSDWSSVDVRNIIICSIIVYDEVYNDVHEQCMAVKWLVGIQGWFGSDHSA